MVRGGERSSGSRAAAAPAAAAVAALAREMAVLDPAQVEEFATLPSREVLYAMLLSAMNGPVRSVVGVLQGVIRQLIGTLSAIADQTAQAKE